LTADNPDQYRPVFAAQQTAIQAAKSTEVEVMKKAAIVALAVFLGGCCNMNQCRTTGLVVGAVSGAAIGAAVSHGSAWYKGAAIGAGVGTLAGAVLGNVFCKDSACAPACPPPCPPPPCKTIEK
jgi:uncharacterized protein YcfJ